MWRRISDGLPLSSAASLSLCRYDLTPYDEKQWGSSKRWLSLYISGLETFPWGFTCCIKTEQTLVPKPEFLQRKHARYASRKTEFCCVWLWALRGSKKLHTIMIITNELVPLCNPLMEDAITHSCCVLLLFILTLKGHWQMYGFAQKQRTVQTEPEDDVYIYTYM